MVRWYLDWYQHGAAYASPGATGTPPPAPLLHPPGSPPGLPAGPRLQGNSPRCSSAVSAPGRPTEEYGRTTRRSSPSSTAGDGVTSVPGADGGDLVLRQHSWRWPSTTTNSRLRRAVPLRLPIRTGSSPKGPSRMADAPEDTGWRSARWSKPAVTPRTASTGGAGCDDPTCGWPIT